METSIKVAGSVVLIACIAVALFSALSMFILRSDKINFYERSLFLLATSYPIGVACKVLTLGPEFFRYYLADLGFPIAVSVFLLIPLELGLSQRNFQFINGSHRIRIEMLFSARRFALAIALLLSYSYELTIGVLYNLNPDVQGQVIGNFDWLDMLMYTIGAALALFCLTRRHANMLPVITQYEQDLEAFQKAKRKTAKKATRPAAKEKRSKNRRSGRR